MNEVKHIGYANGTIRNPEGKMIGFFDEEDQILYINGNIAGFRAADMTHAMEIFAENYKGS